MGGQKPEINKNKISVGLLAHVDAGKTTLSEALLYLTGAIRKMGRVDDRDAFLDTYELERERGITIFSKQAVFEMGDKIITLLDTPGHVDFSAEMERTIQVLDAAVLVVSGADGVQGHTRTVWRLLKRHHVPVFLFINKMDQSGCDKLGLMQDLKANLDENGILTGFNEKTADPVPGTINGGIYLMKKSLLEEIPEGKVSLENEMIPKWLSEGKKLGGFVNDGYFIDIGIPEAYFQFQEDVKTGVVH